jgi:transposase
MKRKNVKGKPIMISKVRDIFRLHFEEKLSNEKIAYILCCGKGSVFNYLDRLEKSSLSYLEVKELSDQELTDIIRKRTPYYEKCKEFWPDFDQLVDELSRPHMTRQVLWDEYYFNNPNGMKRTKFYEEIANRIRKTSPSQKMVYKGGEKLFLDYSGSKLKYIDAAQNKPVEVEVFVASLGASSYTYVECSHTQNQKDWVESNIRALEYFNGVPKYLVPDNLKSAVIKPDRYNPVLNESYKKMADYYDTLILPARAKKPQDKSIVEANVKAVQGYIFPRLRNKIFTSLLELNSEIRSLLNDYNNREMQEYKVSRHSRYLELDKDYLKHLRPERYEYSEIKLNISVNKTYHVLYKGHYYSVPFQEIGNKVEIRDSGSTIEIYRSGDCLAVHKKSPPDRGKTTVDAHMPVNHRFQNQFGYEFVCKEAEKVGPNMLRAVKCIMDPSDIDNEFLTRKAYSLVRLQKDYDNFELDNAARYMMDFAKPEFKFLKSILEQNLANEKDKEEENAEIIILHNNIRGSEHYEQKVIGE